MCHAEAATRSRPERPLSSSIMGLSPSHCTHTIVDHFDPEKFPGAPTDPGHSVWGSRRTHHLTPPPRTQISKTAMRPSPPPSRHGVHHCTKHHSSSPPAPMSPPHLDSNMDQARFPQHLHTTFTTAGTKDETPNTTPLRRSRCQGAGAAHPEG
jgi:hypothetical protein